MTIARSRQRKAQSAKRKAQSAKRKAQSAKRKAQSAKRKAPRSISHGFGGNGPQFIRGTTAETMRILCCSLCKV
jgi:hypothetical protein